MRTALDVHRTLLGRDVPHEVVRLDRSILCADDLPGAMGLGREDCVAVRCYSLQGARSPDGAAVHLTAVLVRAGETPDHAVLLEALQARSLRPATADEVNAHTGFAVGLVCPAGLPEDVAVLADSAVGARDVLYTAAGEGGVALGIRTRDLLVACGARVATLTVRPLSHLDGNGWTRRGDEPARVDLPEPRAGAPRTVG